MTTSEREKNVRAFMAVYEPMLKNAVENTPSDFAWPASILPAVVSRMSEAFLAGSYNHDGKVIKSVCKKLGIKFSRRNLETFFTTGQVVK